MMSRRILITILTLTALLLTVGLLPTHGEEEIYSTVVRLHVLANSDSEEDQALKLEVRDAVLRLTEPALRCVKTQKEAAEVLEGMSEEIAETAKNTLAENGCEDDVQVLLGEEEYPEKAYDSFAFPSGTYLSLRVCIGDAEGHNWWCCLFPPLCLGNATKTKAEAEDAFISVGLTPSQYRVITETSQPVYRVRFKLLELIQKIR